VTGQVEQTPAAPATPSRRSRLVRLVRHGFVLAVVAALVLTLWRLRDDVAASLHAISVWRVVLSLLLGILGAWLPGVVWRDLLADQGFPAGRVAGQRAFFVAQLGKYLPGGIWSLVAQVAMARDLKIPGRQAATATFLTIAFSIISSLLVAAVTLPIAFPHVVAAYWWVFLAVPVLLVLLHPRSIAWWSGTAFRLLRRPGEPVRLSWPVLVRSTVLLIASWLALGAHFGVLVTDVAGNRSSLWLLSIGVFGLAWVAGFLVVIAPAGAGVREAALVLGFTGVLAAGGVLALAVLSRVLLIVADVVLAGVFLVTARLHARGVQAGAPDTAPRP
jgi:uncharacterized membrane protein YbhN (UPF0104 family)